MTWSSLLDVEDTRLAQRRGELQRRRTSERLEQPLHGLEVNAFEQIGASKVMIPHYLGRAGSSCTHFVGSVSSLGELAGRV